MSDVVDLTEIRLAPVSETVAVLEDLLERARRGEIRGVAVAASCDQGCDASAYALGDGGIASLVLALRRLEVRLLDHCEG